MVDDYRPIVLLSVIYRLWAKARGPPMEDWMRKAGIACARGPRAAESLATEVALHLTAVHASDDEMAGLAFGLEQVL